MRAIEVHGLTERQAELVEATIEKGKLKWACQEIGYDYRNALRLFNESPGFQQAITEALRLAQIQDAIMARKALADAMESTDDDAVKVRAAKDILDRGIGKAPDRVQHDHKHSLDRDELRERIGTLASELGISAASLLEKKAVEAKPAESDNTASQQPPVEDTEFRPTLPRLK